MKKSLISLVLAFSLVLSVAVPAFAATPSDVAGKPSQSAVEELIALGVLNGYPDGTFQPDNKITRAELAKVAVIASGSESAANIMASVKSTFKDVKTTDWFNGYVNAAQQKNLIKGYEDGTYKPGANISVNEVVTILVRALGYTDADLGGTWPYNYLIKADELGLFKGIDTLTGDATRGVVAQLTSATIDLPTVVRGKEGYTVDGAPLVSKIGEPKTGILTKPAIDKKKVNISGVDVDVADNVIVTGGKQLASLFGHDITYIVKGGKVVAISDNQKAANTVVGVKDVAQTVSNSTYVTVKVGNDVVTKQYAATGAVNSFVNGDANAVLPKDSSVELYLNADGTVRFVKAFNYNHVDARVTGIDAATPYRAAIVKLDTDATAAGVTAAQASAPESTVITLNGAPAKVTDLAVNDIVTVAKNNAGVAIEIKAVRSAVTGKVSSVNGVGTAKTYTIEGNAYKSNVALNFGDNYLYFLNAAGEIAQVIEPTAGVNSNDVFVLSNTPATVVEDGVLVAKYKVSVYTVKDGQTKEILLSRNDAVIGGTESPYAAQLLPGKVFTLSYDSKGAVSDVSAAIVDVATTVNVDTKTSNTVKSVTGVTYQYNSNLVVLDATKFAADKKVSAGTLDSVTKGDTIAWAASNGTTLSYIVLINDVEAAGNVENKPVYGVLLNTSFAQTSATSYKYFVTLNVNGESKDFPVDEYVYEDLTDAVADKMKYAITLSDVVNGLFTDADVDSIADATYTTAANNGVIDLDGDEYIVTANTVVYFVDKNGNVSVGSYADIQNATTVEESGKLYIQANASANTIGSYTEAAIVVVTEGTLGGL